MQKVAWPIMIVHRLNVMPRLLIDAFSAIAVTMPGSAIGSTRKSETAFRPKNRNRWTANAARLPRTRARIVAIVATIVEFVSASRTSGLFQARVQYLVVNSSIGHFWPTLALKL